MATEIQATTPTNTRITVAQILVELGYIKTRIDKFAGYDDRLKKIERVVWALSGAFGLAVIVLVPVAAEAIKVWWIGP